MNMMNPDGKSHRKEPYFSFNLPEDEYKDLMFDRRLALEGSRSPSALSSHLPSEQSSRNQRHSTIDDTDGTCGKSSIALAMF